MNETADEMIVGEMELLDEHVPVQSDGMVTLGELLTVQEFSQVATEPSKEKLNAAKSNKAEILRCFFGVHKSKNTINLFFTPFIFCEGK